MKIEGENRKMVYEKLIGLMRSSQKFGGKGERDGMEMEKEESDVKNVYFVDKE